MDVSALFVIAVICSRRSGFDRNRSRPLISMVGPCVDLLPWPLQGSLVQVMELSVPADERVQRGVVDDGCRFGRCCTRHGTGVQPFHDGAAAAPGATSAAATVSG